VGNTPSTSPTWWLKVSPTNYWAMFDGSTSTPTTASNSLTVVVRAGITDSISLLEITGTTVSVNIHVDGNLVYSETDSLLDTRGKPMLMIIVFPTRFRKKFYRLNLPPYLNAVTTIVISGLATVGCGMLVMGNQLMLGETQYGAAPSIEDYSTVTFDSFGVATLVVRNWSPIQTVDFVMKNSDLDFLYIQLAKLRATPVLWLGADEGYDSLVTFGIYRQFKPVISYPTVSMCNLEIKGII